MTLTLTVKNQPEVERSLTGFLSKEASALTAQVFKRQILDNTSKGYDYRGAPFKPYKPAQRALRDKLGLETQVVNLRISGSMLDSFYWSSQDRMLAPSKEQAAKVHGNQIRWGRLFVGINSIMKNLARQAIIRLYNGVRT